LRRIAGGSVESVAARCLYLPAYRRRQIGQVNVIVANIPEARQNLRKWGHNQLVAMATLGRRRCGVSIEFGSVRAVGLAGRVRSAPVVGPH
jgi:hypothetical protein